MGDGPKLSDIIFIFENGRVWNLHQKEKLLN